MAKAINLSDYSEQELRLLNRQICNYLKELEFRKAQDFRRGDRVEWIGRYGRQTGEVLKINRQTVQVMSSSGCMWKVSASLLRPEVK